ncbi:DUF3152 domain-containing protein [Aquipuribacter sp. SD81]|uniref:DUF3152 domain-containing protein n=1 Tax=Aquipuribacter sp. SD81 TaxID=3127703 RepID=UPI00301937E8
MATTERVRRRGGAPDGEARDPRASRRERSAALGAAAVVLVLWGVWLAVPGGADREPVGAPVAGPATAGPTPQAVPDAQPGEGAALPDRVPGRPAGAAVAPGPAVEDAAAEGPAGEDPAAEGRAAEGRAGEDPAGEDPAGEDPAAAPPEPASPVEVPQAGDGTFAVAPGGSDVVGDGELVTYTVEVEGGVPVDAAAAAAVVDAVLADPRSWTADGRWALQRVAADGDARVVVTSPDTTDRLCAPLRTRGQVSCRNGDDVVLNAVRWTRGATTWGEDVEGYREYLVNHEVGHLLGHGHVPCPATGEAAPVMLQQTIRLDGCEPNAWPFP